MKKDKIILDFFAEAGLLKRVKRSGWWVVGVKDPESVAEHSFRCAVIGYVLAKMENADPYSAAMMCLFNDIHEARINDSHKLVVRYIDHIKAEDKAYIEQCGHLPEKIKNELMKWRKNFIGQKTKESIVARDADILECLLQAKEYYEHGNLQTKLFFQKAPGFLKSKSAKNLWKEMARWKSSDWWQRICEFKR